MNWIVFILCAWVCFGFEIGLRSIIGLGPSGDEIAPSFVVPLLVFIALQAPPKTVLWGALLLGAITDLTTRHPTTADAGLLTLIGPASLGYLLAAQLVISARGLVIHRNPITHVALSAMAGAIIQIVIVAILTTRSLFGDAIEWQATHELFVRLGSAVYTGGVALFVAFILYAIGGLFSFQGVYHAPAHPRRRGGLIS